MTVILQQEAFQNPQLASTPTRKHVAVHRQQAGLMSNEAIHAAISDYEYILELASVDDQYSEIVNAHSRLNALAAIAGYRAELQWRKQRGLTKPQSSLGWEQAFLDRLKAAVRIEDEVSRVLPLRPRGKALVGVCPFHNDRNPSLTVWPDSGRWRCFGCGVYGDVFTWTQATACMSFSESVHYIAAMAGVEVPRKARSSRRRVVQIGGC